MGFCDITLETSAHVDWISVFVLYCILRITEALKYDLLIELDCYTTVVS